MSITDSHLEKLKELARNAGKAILEIYNSSDFGIEQKADDSPLTLADKKSNEIICKGIEALGLPYPIISEENTQIPFEIRKNFKRFWLIDPLDGTKEFINRNGDFTVNIALIEDKKPITGIIYAVCEHELYWAIKGQGAYSEIKCEIRKLQAAQFDINSDAVRVVASRSHLNKATAQLIDKLKNPIITNRGSSLKFMMLANASADYYPRMSQVMEWDVAAAQIILEEAGGKVIDLTTKKALEYNKIDMIVPSFIACGIGNHKF
jgi:3'(2'), 5'-bisphosphate nucleotidase